MARFTSNFLFGFARVLGLTALVALGAPAARAALDAREGPRVVGRERGAALLYASYWRRMMARNWGGEEACVGALGRGCNLDDWEELVDGLRGLAPRQQLEKLNRAINRERYREDGRNWGRRDYWAAPREFFARGGDCEDFVIVKYLSLRALGFPAADLRLAILYDTRRAIAHAVLAVKLEGEDLVLDNVHSRILPLRKLPHYQVHYSVNEETVLRHLARRP